MLDVDGTIVSIKEGALPSDKVVKAIEKAKQHVHISLITARPLFYMNKLFDYLNLSGPSVINGGSQIIDAKTRKILWEQSIAKDDLNTIVETIDDSYETVIIDSRNNSHPVSEFRDIGKPVKVVIVALSLEQADKMINKLSKISKIATYKSSSFTKNRFDLIISHASATKQHAIFEIKKLLNIDTQELIGVGDTYNDFPLLMACGLKVAMGNAVGDLKEIADYIAPDINEDGVADVIEKFILNKEI